MLLALPLRMSDFDYPLPDGAIAQTPVEPRHDARLLVDDGPDAPLRHLTVADLPSLLGPGDVVVVNDTKVLPARLEMWKATGGSAEVFLLEPRPDGTWEALVRPGRRLPPGTVLADETGLEAEIGEILDGGRRVVTVRLDGDVVDGAHPERLDGHGQTPLPPYITTPLLDPGRYQTVFADRPASVAAPTAGLHLTEDVLDGIRSVGATLARVELVVGIDTFRPVTVDDPADHVMHTERYRVPEATWDAVQAADRVVAIGTTTVRALESAAARGELTGRTDLFIRRPYQWAVVDAMMTNFHLPRSTLLLMIDAFVGPRWHDLYTAALDAHYRFLSFGDAMWLVRSP